MNLPVEFMRRMEERLGEQFPAFLRSYGFPARRAIRVNTLKIARGEFEHISPFALERVPWEENGYYVQEEKTGAHAYHFAGLYYSQEPSAMCAAPLLGVKGGEKVLDLCAAPGGKTTQLAQSLGGEGILVANEYVYDRAKILSQNVERLGVRNCAVVSADTEKLAQAFPGYFDKILADAPCSGEGMFKKEPSALAEWSEENVRRCALRQSAILDNAAKMLRGGGRLVYSTCTFSEEENGGQIARFLERHAEFRLLGTQTLYPHEVRGEGHFTALLEKTEGEEGRVGSFRPKRDGAAERAYRDFARNFFADGRGLDGETTVLPDGRMFLVPHGMPSLDGLRVLRAGVELGEWNGKQFKPAHALAMCMKAEEAVRFLPLDLKTAEKYLHGETAESTVADGWCVVGVGNYPIGLGKAVGGVVKNHLPKGLRKIK